MHKVLRRITITGGLFIGGVLALGVASQPETGDGATSRPSYSATYDHGELQRAAEMTQGMSTPNADTRAPVHRFDAQLSHSSDPAFIGDLESHQADIDRMLARPGR